MNKNLLMSAGVASILGLNLVLGQVTPKSPRIKHTTRDEITWVETKCEIYERGQGQAYKVLEDASWNLSMAEGSVNIRGRRTVPSHQVRAQNRLKWAALDYVEANEQVSKWEGMLLWLKCVTGDSATELEKDLNRRADLILALKRIYDPEAYSKSLELSAHLDKIIADKQAKKR